MFFLHCVCVFFLQFYNVPTVCGCGHNKISNSKWNHTYTHVCLKRVRKTLTFRFLRELFWILIHRISHHRKLCQVNDSWLAPASGGGLENKRLNWRLSKQDKNNGIGIILLLWPGFLQKGAIQPGMSCVKRLSIFERHSPWIPEQGWTLPWINVRMCHIHTIFVAGIHGKKCNTKFDERNTLPANRNTYLINWTKENEAKKKYIHISLVRNSPLLFCHLRKYIQSR